MSDRLLFLGGNFNTELKIDLDNIDNLFEIAGKNSGNFVYKTYLKSYLVYDKEKSKDILTVDELNDIKNIEEQFDKIVVICSNQFNKYDTYLLQFYDFLKSTKLPIILLGLGAQSDLNYSTEFLNEMPKHIEFFKMLAKKRCFIGVRGEFTKRCLLKIGINSDVIGCPSYFKNGSNFHIRKKKIFLNFKKINFSCDLHWFCKRKTWYNILKKNKKSQIICQSIDEKGLYKLSKGCANNQDIESIKTLFSISDNSLKTNCFSNRCHLFFSINEWEKFCKNSDFYFGPRIHGCLMHILNGTPAVLLVHDSRTREFAELFKIPYVTNNDIKSNMSIYFLYRKISFRRSIKEYSKLFENYKSFLDKVGLEYDFKEKIESSHKKKEE